MPTGASSTSHPKDVDEAAVVALVEKVQANELRLIVVAADANVARQWAKYRGLKRGYYIAEDAVILTGLNPDGDAIVLVDGYQHHRKYSAIRRRLAIEANREVPVVKDRLPAGEGPAKPAIGGAYLFNNAVNRIPFEDDQGDTFVVGHAAGAIVLRRAAAEQLAILLEGWLSGEPVPDPAMDRLLERRAAVEATGDLYGRSG